MKEEKPLYGGGGHLEASGCGVIRCRGAAQEVRVRRLRELGAPVGEPPCRKPTGGARPQQADMRSYRAAPCCRVRATGCAIVGGGAPSRSTSGGDEDTPPKSFFPSGCTVPVHGHCQNGEFIPVYFLYISCLS